MRGRRAARPVRARHAHCASSRMRHPVRPLRPLASALLLSAAVILATSAVRGNGALFRDDDPLVREPETQDASKAQEWEIDLFIDLAVNLFGQPGEAVNGVAAANVNTIDEVPDSSWFTNRILARPLPIDEAVRGPREGDGPAAGLL